MVQSDSASQYIFVLMVGLHFLSESVESVELCW